MYIKYFSYSLILLLQSYISYCADPVRYEPNWQSLDARPLPDWYGEAKFGIFIHWGLFAVPSYNSEWFWWNWEGPLGGSAYDQVNKYVKDHEKPGWTYADYASQFKAEFYDPDQWADIFNASGARYVVLTTKHHEGFTMWPSKYSFNWNAMQVGPKRDLVGDLAKSIRNRTSIRFGVYHSLFEWFNNLWIEDLANSLSTRYFSKGKTMPELYELVNNYKPDIIWSDGSPAEDWYWNSTGFLAWLYNDSPVKDSVVVNDRWCLDCPCNHGGFLTCSDGYNPGVLQKRKFETCISINTHSWGYVRDTNAGDFRSVESILQQLASAVSCGGNLLLNVGPTADGRIIPILEERLRQIGKWLSVNGEAIYSSIPWSSAQKDPASESVWYTSKKSSNSTSGYFVYAIVLSWPDDNNLVLGAPVPTTTTKVQLLGYEPSLKFNYGKTFNVTFPTIPYSKLPCEWAWVLKITNLET